MRTLKWIIVGVAVFFPRSAPAQSAGTSQLTKPAKSWLVMGSAKDAHDRPLAHRTVTVWDEDGAVDTKMAQGTTNQYGQFTIEYPSKQWDPPAPGDPRGSPDIYVTVSAKPSALPNATSALVNQVARSSVVPNAATPITRLFAAGPELLQYLSGIDALKTLSKSPTGQCWRLYYQYATGPQTGPQFDHNRQLLLAMLDKMIAVKHRVPYPGTDAGVTLLDQALEKGLQGIRTQVQAKQQVYYNSNDQFFVFFLSTAIEFNVRWSPFRPMDRYDAGGGCDPDPAASSETESCSCVEQHVSDYTFACFPGPGGA